MKPISLGKKINSHSIENNGIHLLSDFVTTIGIVIGLYLVKKTGLNWIDGLIAIIVGLLLIKEGIKIFLKSTSNLLDAESIEIIEELVSLFEKHYRPGMIQIHSLRTVRSGDYHHIDLHLVVPEFWSINEGHNFGESLEATIFKEYRYNGELHFHLDPCSHYYCSRCELANCPIRQNEFKKRVTFSFEEVTLKDEDVKHI